MNYDIAFVLLCHKSQILLKIEQILHVQVMRSQHEQQGQRHLQGLHQSLLWACSQQGLEQAIKSAPGVQISHPQGLPWRVRASRLCVEKS